MTKNVLYKLPGETIWRNQIWKNMGAREWVPLLLSNDQETPCPERHEHKRSEMMHDVTGKLFPQGRYKVVFSIIDRNVSEGGSILLPPSSPNLNALEFFFWGIVKKFFYHEKVQNLNELHELSELQSVLPMKCLPMPAEKLNIVLMCVVSLMVPMLSSHGHIRSSVMSSA
jgi:hypothetical protein